MPAAKATPPAPPPETPPPAPEVDEQVSTLEKENADLREQLAAAKAAAERDPVERPTLVTTADTAAFTGGVTSGRAEPARPRRIVVSEGVKNDLERLGEVVDPGTGYLLRLDRDSGEITVVDRLTKQTVDIPTV